MAHHDHGSPLMAIHLHALPLQEIHPQKQIHPRQKYEMFCQLQQAAHAEISPIVDHLVVTAPVATFVCFHADTVAGVKISCESPTAAEMVCVRVHHDTGLEIYATNGHVRQERVLVEVFLPMAFALRSLEVHGHATVVVEDMVLPIKDPYANIHIHQVGECKIFMASQADINVNSLTLEPEGGGLIQLTAPTVTLRESLTCHVTAVGCVRVFATKIKAPVIKLDAAGYGKIHVSTTLETEAMANLRLSAVGKGSVVVNSNFLRADRIKASVSGMGNAAFCCTKELVANFVESSADGQGNIAIASPLAHCNIARLDVAGQGSIAAQDLVAREALVDATGAGAVHFRASEVAHANVQGYGSAMLVGPLPPRVTGRVTALAEGTAPPHGDDIAGHTQRGAILTPTRTDPFDKAMEKGLFDAIKSLWTTGYVSSRDDNVARALTDEVKAP